MVSESDKMISPTIHPSASVSDVAPRLYDMTQWAMQMNSLLVQEVTGIPVVRINRCHYITENVNKSN